MWHKYRARRALRLAKKYLELSRYWAGEALRLGEFSREEVEHALGLDAASDEGRR